MEIPMDTCEVMRGSKTEWELADALPGGPVGKYWVGKYGWNPWFIYDANPYWNVGITICYNHCYQSICSIKLCMDTQLCWNWLTLMEIEHMEMMYIYQYHKKWLEIYNIDLSHGNFGHVFFLISHGPWKWTWIYKNSRRYGNGVLVHIPWSRMTFRKFKWIHQKIAMESYESYGIHGLKRTHGWTPWFSMGKYLCSMAIHHGLNIWSSPRQSLSRSRCPHHWSEASKRGGPVGSRWSFLKSWGVHKSPWLFQD